MVDDFGEFFWRMIGVLGGGRRLFVGSYIHQKKKKKRPFLESMSGFSHVCDKFFSFEDEADCEIFT